MATFEWCKKKFGGGYDSGEILDPVPLSTQLREEVMIGGSYRDAFRQAVFPFLRPDLVILELGPGKGSWTCGILEFIPEGRIETLDVVDVRPWLQPERYGGRLICHQVSDNLFSCVSDGAFDFFWSFGVLCHHSIEQIRTILKNARAKMKRGGVAAHEYGDWEKFYTSGRMVNFPDLVQKPDVDHWWPSNNARAMCAAAEDAGWEVIVPDLGLFQRHGIILLKAW